MESGKSWGLALACVAIPSLLAAVPAAPADDDESAGGPVTRIEAIAIAEEISGGRALRAEWEDVDGPPVYEVLIRMSDGSLEELEIDVATGTLVVTEPEDCCTD